MDAEKYIKENKRMCNSYDGCINCPFNRANNNEMDYCIDTTNSEIVKKQVEIVEKWSKEHPIVTNAMKFKEVFGCEPYETMTIRYCPPVAYRTSKCMRNCEECKVWWDEEWKEPKND